MKIIADLHIHSRFSRACSKQLSIANIEKWAKVKGLSLVGTGDFCHPKWIEELKKELTEDGTGILKTNSGFHFVLQNEISLIYTQGRGRRIHLVLLAPDFATVDKITKYLLTKGRIDYDGRPIFNITCIDFVKNMKAISDDIEIIPAHCLLPDELVHGKNGVKKIKEFNLNELVLTHKGRFRKINEIHIRDYSGEVIKIIPSCLKESNFVTPEHPVLSIKSYKSCKNVPHSICKPTCAYLKRNCKSMKFKEYKSCWIQAKHIEAGDIVLYPRYNEIHDVGYILLNELLSGFYLDEELLKSKNEPISVKNIPVKNKINISDDFCRLIGYFLSEGYVSRDKISFTFSKKEKKYIDDVKEVMVKIFGDRINFYDEKEKSGGVSFSVHSKILCNFFKQFYSSRPYRSFTKILPSWFMDLPLNKQKQILVGWWRGDGGYTTSVILANQMKTILIRLGIIPSVSKDLAENRNIQRLKNPCMIGEREILANHDCYQFSNLSFFDENNDLLNLKEFKKFKTKLMRRRGWLDKDFIYLPVLKVMKKSYSGKVYNFEVEKDNSYVTEALSVHNCWTPWFGLFGSKTGFDTVEEAFGEQSKHIHALETGLSSDPEMNWQLSNLDRYQLVSFSDSHSFWPWRIGRESTVFEFDELTYKNLIKAIRTGEGLVETIEVDPNYGKYHFDGHRNCNISFSPEESKKHNGICPVCKKPLTIGVLNRVEDLADRKFGFKSERGKPFKRIIPLHELISLSMGAGIATKKVWAKYNEIMAVGENEFDILLNVPKEKLLEVADEQIVDLIIKNRQGKLLVKAGYDGEYGVPQIGDKKDKSEVKQEEQRDVEPVSGQQKGLNDFI